MGGALTAVIALALVVGVATNLAAGRLPAVGAFVAVLVVGSTLVVLGRNRKDRAVLQAALTNEGLEDVGGGEPGPRGRT